VEQARQPKDWYAIVLRRHPEIVLVVDRYSLNRAWIVARLMLPELGSVDMAFRTMQEKEVDELQTGRQATHLERNPRRLFSGTKFHRPELRHYGVSSMWPIALHRSERSGKGDVRRSS
jgi:hypothetical protein